MFTPSLQSALKFAEDAFSLALRGNIAPAHYVALAQNATASIEALRPDECISFEDHASSTCTAWRAAAENVSRTTNFFRGLRSMGRLEETCEGNVDLTEWEEANVTGAMMDPELNRRSLEEAFREMVSALRGCTPEASDAPGPFFPTSGTLVALLRYGDLVGTLPGNKLDFVDNDLDFFIMIPGNASYLWANNFVPCINLQLGGSVLKGGEAPLKPQSPEIKPTVTWSCRDATADREIRLPGRPELLEADKRLMGSDYLQCSRLPPADETVDLLSQTVVVDLVRILTFPDDGPSGEFLGGWDRGVRLPLNLLLPPTICRAGTITVPCPNQGLEFLKARGSWSSAGNHTCYALIEVTSDRCSYHPDNVRLLRDGMDERDVVALREISTTLAHDGFASFFAEHGSGGCVAREQEKSTEWPRKIDARIYSSVYNNNRVTEVGGEPIRLFFYRFRMLSRLAAARLSFSSDEMIAIWGEENTGVRVSNIFAERLTPLLTQMVRLILGLETGTWHTGEFRFVRPLEYCAARFFGHILGETEFSDEAEVKWCYDLSNGPNTFLISSEEWSSTFQLLLKLFEGQQTKTQDSSALLSSLKQDAVRDGTRESWLIAFDLNAFSWRNKEKLLMRRQMHYQFSQLCRLLVAQWVFGSNIGTLITANPYWSEAFAFGIELSTHSSSGYIETMKSIADTIMRIASVEEEWKSHMDIIHWPQVGCASLLVSLIVQNCPYGNAETYPTWFSWECPNFVVGGRGPWRVTGLLLHRMASFSCAVGLSDKRIRVKPGKKSLIPSDSLSLKMLTCFTELAHQERLRQTAWGDITVPLMITRQEDVPNEEECLRLAAAAASNFQGGTDFTNPIARIPIHSKCPVRAPEYLMPLGLRLAMRRLRIVRVEEHPKNRVVCDEDGDTQEALHYNKQYVSRANEGFCRHPQGMWGNLSLAAPITKCKYSQIAKLFNFRPGLRVLELGSGCAHHLHFLYTRFGIRAIGVDLLKGNTRYARENFGKDMEALCTADVAEPASFISNSTFDVVLSHAVLRELPVSSQCATVMLALRYLSPGGCAWFGWLRDYKVYLGGQWYHQQVPRSQWSLPGCLYPRKHRHTKKPIHPLPFVFGIVSEARFFGSVEYADSVGRGSYSLFICKSRRRV